MAIRTKDILKSWFRTGLYPTQEQFWDLFDSYYHKLEGINFDDVTGLIEYLNERNTEILNQVNEIVTEAAKNLQLQRRIQLTMERTTQDLFFDEEMTIYRVGGNNVASMTVTIGDTATPIALDTDVEVLIPAGSIAIFSIVKQLTDPTAYLYIRAKVTPS
jgi:hypothetical protein